MLQFAQRNYYKAFILGMRMRITRHLSKITLVLLLASCIEPIGYDVPSAGNQLVVDGFINNEPGPYTVKLSRNLRLAFDMDFSDPVSDASIHILSDAGEDEVLIESEPGVYVTDQLQGVVGRTYTLHVTTKEGETFESIPETILPPGEVQALNFDFEHRTKMFNGIEIPDDRFNIYVDSKSVEGSENFIRWKVTGTYKIETKPWLITMSLGGERFPNPPPCSGWAVVPNIGLKQVGECSCCTCWVTNYEAIPQVSDEQFISGKEFRNVRIGVVPITRETFYEKYHVTVNQMSLSRMAFEYFRLIKAQKEGATSLFQPASGKLRGNIIKISGERDAQGIFFAAGVNTGMMFLDRDDVPYKPQPLPDMAIECNFLVNSTTQKPIFWE